MTGFSVDGLVAAIAATFAIGFASAAMTPIADRLSWRPVRRLRDRHGRIATRLFLALVAFALGAASIAIVNDWRPSYAASEGDRG